MKPINTDRPGFTFDRLNPAGLILAAIGMHGARGLTFSESTRLRRHDPERLAAAQARNLRRNARRLHLAHFRGAFGAEPFVRGAEPWL